MSDKVWITLSICTTVVLVVWMIRSSVMRLTEAKRENFTFLVRFFGAEMWLVRGAHRLPADALPSAPRLGTGVPEQPEQSGGSP
jgi:hypothetical protein